MPYSPDMQLAHLRIRVQNVRDPLADSKPAEPIYPWNASAD